MEKFIQDGLARLVSALPVIGWGYLGIFIVTIVIILIVTLLNKLGGKD